jgi:hypothetical protein
MHATSSALATDRHSGLYYIPEEESDDRHTIDVAASFPTSYKAIEESPVLVREASDALRQGFLRKVFGILTLQLGLSVGVTFLCMSSVGVHHWLRRDPTVIWLCMFLAVTCMMALVCVGPARQWYPANLILLSSYVRRIEKHYVLNRALALAAHLQFI